MWRKGDGSLTFGLGLPPCFPLTDLTTLHAPAQSCFTEEAEFMPGQRLELSAALDFRIEAEAAFRDYCIFMPDAGFEPGFAGDCFCFEPMTHHTDAHHSVDPGGLAILAPGQMLSGTLSFSSHELPMADRNAP